MKNVLWKFPQIPAEIPGYFYHIESLFNLYEVDGDVRLNFYKRNYLIKQSFFKVRLTKEQHGDYDALKEFSSTSLRYDRFRCLNKFIRCVKSRKRQIFF